MERDTVLNGSASVFGKFSAFKLKPLNSSLLILLFNTDPIILQNSGISDFLVLLLLLLLVLSLLDALGDYRVTTITRVT